MASNGRMVVQRDLVVPAGGGIVTSWTVRVQQAGRLTFKTLDGASVTNSVAATAPQDGLSTFPTRIPVGAGESLGLGDPDDSVALLMHAPGTGHQELGDGDPAPGEAFAVTGTATAALALAAVVERDADGDGWGDESQDGCPEDPARHEIPCTTDLELTQSLTPAEVALGELAELRTTVTNVSNATAFGVALSATAVDGVAFEGAQPATGVCSGAACRLGAIAPGASASVTFVVRGTRGGVRGIDTSVTSEGPERTPGTNLATSSLTVVAPLPVPVSLVPVVVAPVAVCVVPNLIGRTLAKARTLLRRAGCAVKSVRKPRKAIKGGRLRVSKVSARPGARAPRGTKVILRLAYRR